MNRKVVLVQFGVPSSDGKEYAYFIRPDLEAINGNVVVVETPRQLSLATITTTKDIDPQQASFASKWIVDVVDTQAHEAYLEELNESPC